MKIIFFGTSGGISTQRRNVTSIGLERNLEHWSMVDCGDGTTYQVARANWKLEKLDSIFITHLHADHFFGILSLLFRKDMIRENCDLTLYAPKGMQAFIENSLTITKKVFENFKLTIVEVEEGMKIEFKAMKIEVFPMQHRISSYGYYIETENKKIMIAGDNDNPAIMKEHLSSLDLWVHEATFIAKEYVNKRKNSMHTTAKLLGEVAQKYKVKWLIATHISGRHQDEEGLKELHDEIASSYTNRLNIANDLDAFEI